MGTVIHPTAIVDSTAKLGENVNVGPCAVIESNVDIGDSCEIGPHALIAWGTTLGARCKIYHCATVGTIPQDLKFAGEETTCIVGDDCIIREYVSINRGTMAAGSTTIGNRCAILAYGHVGHDSIVGDNLIASNNLALAGHVVFGNHVTTGGYCSFHQFTRIGDHAMIGASHFISQDVVPFALVGNDRIVGINSVGLERRGFSEERRRNIKRAYKILFREQLQVNDALEKLKNEFPGDADIASIITFAKGSTRGLLRMAE